ncbi:GMC oxidoreductase [Alteromonas lipotrueiana]|uniref:GMC oxidoreductase n=1 Tax=Alteromonas lipotrueiana TaxID=2803815 RepID=UPI001C45A3D6|nr:GMC oxidoreductase [Alteromonas lipotrueiana]
MCKYRVITFPRTWSIELQAQGEMLPNRENQVTLHLNKKNKWGMPQLNINCRWSGNENAMMESALDVASLMMKKAGFRNIEQRSFGQPPGLAIHEVGTVRMG